jgi:hypothetical protein
MAKNVKRAKKLAEPQAKLLAEVARRKRVVRNFPAAPFEDAVSFALQIFEFGSGQPVRRLTLFDYIKKAPESGPSRQLITNASKYGLVKGSYTAETLELTPDGLRAIDPEMPVREQARAKIKLGIQDVEVFGKLHEKFVGKALPAKAALIDAAKELEIPADAAEEAIDTFIVNLRYVGLLRTLSGAERIVSVDLALDGLPSTGSTASGRPSTLPVAQSLITAAHAQFEATCFYVAPIGEVGSEQRKHSDLFLGSIVEPALLPFGLTVIRADTIDRPGIITKQVIEYLVKARLVIVDLSFHNPNVFYELAIRHMMRLPLVQIVRSGDKIPFDVNQMRTLIFDTTDIYTLVPKIETYRAEIASQVRKAIDDAEAVDTPISTYFPDLKVALG